MTALVGVENLRPAKALERGETDERYGLGLRELFLRFRRGLDSLLANEAATGTLLFGAALLNDWS
jgi:hypothetical protein